MLLGQSGLRLVVVVRQHIAHRIDAPETIGVQRVTAGRARGGLLADRVLTGASWLEYVHHCNVEPPARGL